RRPHHHPETKRVDHVYAVNQTATTTATATIAAHTTGVTFLSLPLRGESLAEWLNSVFIVWSVARRQRKTPRILSHNDSFSRSPSAFDGAGCAALTGSEAGKVPTRPFSSFSWVSRSASIASWGSGAGLSLRDG